MQFSLIKYLSQKIRVTATRTNTEEELWQVNLSRISILLWGMLIIVMFIALIIFLTFHSPLANYIPGFHGKKSQQKIIEALYKLDSLTNEVDRWEKYNDNLILVLEGGNSVSEAVDSITKTDRKIAPRIILDSIFRERVRQDSNYHYKGRNKTRRLFELLPPSSGMINARFNPGKGINGIQITPPPSGEILAVMDGTIISSSWDPAYNWIIIIQHSSGIISKYKYLASSLFSPGQIVSAGDAIGFAASLESGVTPKLEFELWQNGNLVDPETYIKF